MTEQESCYRDPLSGRVLNQRFRLDEQIGSGSMGAVYRAWDLCGDRICAVKVLRPDLTKQSAIVVRFQDEAKIIARLYHPNIVEMIDCGEDSDGLMFFAMEFLQGYDLHALLQKESQLSPQRTIDIVRQVGSALHSMHLAGVVHRDIKPRNIFIVHSETDKLPLVKVIDFGLSKWLDGQDRASDGLLIGTPEYLPPESWSGQSREVDARADQWALGVMTYRMLTGRLPFESHDDPAALAYEIRKCAPRPIRELLPDLPEHIEYAVTRALSKDKAQRFASVCEFVRELVRLPVTMQIVTAPARLEGTLVHRDVSFPFPLLPSTILPTQPAPIPEKLATKPLLPGTQEQQVLTVPLTLPPPTALLAEPPKSRFVPPVVSPKAPPTALRWVRSLSPKQSPRRWSFPSWTPWLLTAALLGWNVRGLRVEASQVDANPIVHAATPSAVRAADPVLEDRDAAPLPSTKASLTPHLPARAHAPAARASGSAFASGNQKRSPPSKRVSPSPAPRSGKDGAASTPF